MSDRPAYTPETFNCPIAYGQMDCPHSFTAGGVLAHLLQAHEPIEVAQTLLRTTVELNRAHGLAGEILNDFEVPSEFVHPHDHD